jgi:hypothetical protein
MKIEVCCKHLKRQGSFIFYHPNIEVVRFAA